MKFKHIFILIAFFVLSACIPLPPEQPQVSLSPSVKTVESEDELFSNAEKMFQKRVYTKAAELYNEYLSRFPNGKSAASALMRKGDIHILMGNPSTAREAYKTFIDKYPSNPQIQDAWAGIITAYYKEGDYKQVVRNSDEALKKLSSKDHVFKVNVLVADSYMAIGSAINAVYFYAMAKKGYSDKEGINEKLKKAVSQLTSPDILALSERLGSDLSVKGYLMYQLGQNYINEERKDE
jgi:outer membrane protein assembly factor BamD (BamD/ComL family)